jgi:hypothetical protein
MFSLKFTKYLFSLVNELSIFEYKCANVKLSSSQAWEDRIYQIFPERVEPL